MNPKISKFNIFFADWFKHGIHLISDIVDEQGVVVNLELLKQKFNFNVNFLNYLTIRKCITEFIKNNQSGVNFSCAKPCIPFHIRSLISTVKASKIFYKAFTECHTTKVKVEQKWNLELLL